MQCEVVGLFIDQPCLACGNTMFRRSPLDPAAVPWGVHVNDSIQLQFDGVDHYYECSHCKAHNAVVHVGDGLRIRSIKGYA